MQAPRHSLLLLSFCLSLSAAGAGPLEDGQEALARGQAELALKFFKVAIQTMPDSEAAWDGYRRATELSLKKGSSSASKAPAPSFPEVPAAPSVPLASQDGPSPALPSQADKAQIARAYIQGKPIFFSDDLAHALEGRQISRYDKAQRRYEEERDLLTKTYARKYKGKLAISTVLFTPKLYSHLVAARAAKSKLSSDDAIQLWKEESKEAFRLLEFWVHFKNLTFKGGIQGRPSPIDLGNIQERIFLEDDRGNRYKPYKVKGPAHEVVRDETSMTVWFAPIHRSGTPLWETAVSELRVVLENQPGEADRIVFAFPKRHFQRMVQVR